MTKPFINSHNRFVVDPPSGWRYGFPRIYDERLDGTMEQWLLKHGYPQKDIAFALNYSRMWLPDDELKSDEKR
jgi:hypothetical protein